MSFEPFTFIVEQVGQLLVDEVKFLATDKDELLRNLRQQLELAQSFVRDVEDQKQQSSISHVLETESQHIRKIIPEFEDYLDELFLEEESLKSQQPSSIQKLMACFSCSSNPLVRRRVVIDQALKLIGDLKGARERAGLFQIPSNTPQVARRRQPKTLPNIMNEELIVGLDEDVKTLVAKFKGTDGERRTVFAIVGMGGSGKTTLARKLYNHEEIKGQFSGCHAWVCVSQDWDTSKLLHEICEKLHISVREGESSTIKLQEFLQKSSCFVVLDDVWEKEVLQELLPVLLSGRGGWKESGRIMITTRNEEILHLRGFGGVYIHKAHTLTAEQSWVLFARIISSEWGEIRSLDEEGMFAKLGKKMLEKCHGLPLAIVALAGVLSKKETIQKWRAMEDRVSSTILGENECSLDYGPVVSMLELSYLDLPYDLKPCFIYLGTYPEDFWIDVDVLIQLWIGEELIRSDQCEEGQTLEERGMEIVNELVQRSMVQVVRRDYKEEAEVIQVHDLMRDLCLRKAKELKFFEIVSPLATTFNSDEPLSRRAILHNCRKKQLTNTSRLRSVTIWDNCFPKLEITFGEMKLLRVLQLYQVELTDSAQEIGNLTLLRYLSFERCEGMTDNILEPIKKLLNLLILVLGGLHYGRIPNNMVGSMKQLRYLRVGGCPKFEELLGVGGLGSLQILEAGAGEWLSKELRTASFIHTLRKLALYRINSQVQLDAVYGVLSNSFGNLQTLWLSIDHGSKTLELDLQRMKLECCQLLEHLQLQGHTRPQKGPFVFPPNLLKLHLQWGKFENVDNLKMALARLHHLRHLTLDGCLFQGDKLSMAGLLQLQLLQLSEMGELKEWRIEEGSLPHLKYLKIRHLEKLERVPKEIGDMHNLQYFHAYYMSKSFCKRLEKPPEKEDGNEGSRGQDFHLIRHVPDIKISTAYT